MRGTSDTCHPLGRHFPNTEGSVTFIEACYGLVLCLAVLSLIVLLKAD